MQLSTKRKTRYDGCLWVGVCAHRVCVINLLNWHELFSCVVSHYQTSFLQGNLETIKKKVGPRHESHPIPSHSESKRITFLCIYLYIDKM